MNADQFSRSLLEMASYVEGSIDDVIRKACIDLYRRIIERTPVDTGRAKGAWGIDVNAPGGHEIPEGNYNAGEIASIINSQVSDYRAERIGNQVVIYNNLEYIEALEDGNSQQAPAGMVSISLSEFESFFNQAIQELAGDIT